ncbi:hypothetical protein [Rhizobium sp. BK176]|uniref:hypothetical protein n=1 Tax=Rhizobium sp. BK176 TaxID=2587071 RepID=UPI002166D9C9|nr:hypothetical protein [Rhizobium sp. BK176]MCS4089455.1 hypothetical protein [Rhizobium sp. BK176]
MLTNIRYPIHFGAQPTTTDRYKVVLCSYPFRRDVPEVEAGEAETVLDLSDEYVNGRLVEYDGRLFRNTRVKAEDQDHKSLLNSFECSRDRNTPHKPMMSFEDKSRPLGVGLWNRIAHRVYVNANGRTGEGYAWPNAPFNMGHATWDRNEFTYEKWSKKIGSFAADEFQNSLNEAEREIDRLLWIGDELWIETPPLAYQVGYNGDDFDVRLAFLPDWLDLNLDRQYFPLADKTEALVYAEQANARLKGRRTVDHTKMIERRTDNALLEFDHVAYALNRAALLMGGDVAVNIHNKPDNTRRMTEVHHDAIDEVRAEIGRIGWNPSSWHVAHLAGDIAEAWQRAGKPQGWTHFTSNRTNFSHLTIERVNEQIDYLPIMIDTNRQGPGL